MNTSVKFGIYTGLSVAVWTIIMGYTGWFKDPILLNLFWVVVIFQFVLLFIGMKKSSIEVNTNGESGKSYTQLIKDGLLITIIAGVLIFLSSIFFTTVLYPEYFSELHESYRQILTSLGKSEIEIEKLLEENSRTQTPFLQAFLTGLLGSAIFSAIFRKR